MSFITRSLKTQKRKGKKKKANKDEETYSTMDATTGQSKLHSESEDDRLSRYNTLSHQAGIRFFSPESYPETMKGAFSCLILNKNEKHLLEMMSVWIQRMFSACNFLSKTASKFLFDMSFLEYEEKFHALTERPLKKSHVLFFLVSVKR